MSKVEFLLSVLVLANIFYVGLMYGAFRERARILKDIFTNDPELMVTDEMIIDEDYVDGDPALEHFSDKGKVN